MTADEFQHHLQIITNQALNSGTPPGQILGLLECMKLDLHHAVVKKLTENPAPAIIIPRKAG